MRIIKGATYRHRSCLDLDMHILTISYLGPQYFKLKVIWVNRHNGALTEQPGQVSVLRKDLSNWKQV